MNTEQKKSYTRRITNANKTQMITILYEMVLDYLNDSEKAFNNTDFAQYEIEIKRAQNCIDELINSINEQYELGRNLKSIYLFEKKQLLRALYKRNVEYLNQAEKIFNQLREAYSILEKEDTSNPVMINTQEVYAGMTYGKYSILENMTFNNNRGYRA